MPSDLPALPDLVTLAREAGAAGLDYSDWACSDVVFNAVDQYDAAGVRFDTRAHKAAFCEGRRTFRLAGGWRSLWTTAPADYDCFGTETAEECGDWHGKPLRRVVANPVHADYQAGRYGSGLHGAWNEDPRVEAARIAAERERDRLEREQHEQRRAAGLLWLAEVDEAHLRGDDEDALDQELRDRGLAWSDRTTELKRRQLAREAEERAATWERCRATLADGATLIDPGTAGHRGMFGWVKGRDPDAWRSVTVRLGYPVEAGHAAPDAAEARVIDADGRSLGSLLDVVARLARGDLRLAGPEEHVPPLAVVERLGCRFDEVVRSVVGDRVAWAGRERFNYELRVLDDRGHLVRAAAVRMAAESAFHAKRSAGV